MATSHQRMPMAIGSATVLMAMLQGCLDPVPPGGLIVPAIPASLVFEAQHRRAEGGGFVTVDYAVVPGPMPSAHMGPGPEISVAWFSNRGEGGKKEKRYKWKPRTDAKYELVLSHDATEKKTKWEMREYSLVGGRLHSIAVRSGHLWRCTPGTWHPHPPTSDREVDFRDCQPGIPYDPSETASGNPSAIVRFASHTTEDEGRLNPATAPGWISCDGGCCSLGQ